MFFAYTEDQLLFRNAVIDLFSGECGPDVVRAAWDSDDGRASGLWAQLGAMGVLGVTAPESLGGMGMSAVEMGLILVEAGRFAVPEPIGEHAFVAVGALTEAADNTPAAAEALASAIAGETTIAVEFVNSPFVLGAASADALLAERGGLLYLIDGAQVATVSQESVDGSRRMATTQWDIADATAIGDAGSAAATFDRAALAAAAQLVGISEHLIAVTAAYACEREQFGKPIGVNQGVKHQLANALIQTRFAGPLVQRASYSVASADPATSVHVSEAKAFASDAAMLATRVALQVHGAIGYTFEHDLHLWLKRAWALQRAYGGAVWHRSRVGDAVLG